MISEKKNILLIDSFRTKLLKQSILKDFSYAEVNKPSVKEILLFFFRPNAIIIFLKNIFFLKSITSALIFAHFYTVIKEIQPKIIIGFYIVMKRRYFFHLANEFKEIQFLAIAPSRIDDLNKFNNILPSNAKFFVHGESDANELVSRGYKKDFIYPYGSFYSHYHSDHCNDKQIKFDICILSQYLHQWEEKNMSEERKIQIEIFNLLLKFVKDFYNENSNLKIAIAMRPQEKGEVGSMLEREYFDSKLKDIQTTYIPSNELKGSSYQAAFNSKVIITHYSTLAFELLGFRKKVLFFQPLPFKYSPIPKRLKWKILHPDYNGFKKKLSNLLTMNQFEYEESISNDIKFFNNMENNLIKEVRSTIEETLDKSSEKNKK